MGDERAKKIEAALFLEGRSIPFTSVTCTFSKGRPATAVVRAVPLREINNILPRTLCHIFVRDNSFKGSVKPWVLLFEGEIYGMGSMKTPEQRSTDLYAMDFSSYYDNAKQYYLNLKASTGAGLDILALTNTNKEIEKNQVAKISSGTSTKAYLTKLVMEELKQSHNFLKALKKAIEGVKEVNSFFRYGDARVRLDERMTYADSGRVEELFKFESRETLLDSVMGRGNGGLITIRTVINSLLGMIFHEWITVPAPSKVDSDIVRDRYEGVDVNAQDENRGIGVNNSQTIGSFIMKPESYMLAPPRCNVLFPDYYNSLNFRRIFFNEVTRTEFSPFTPTIKRNLPDSAVQKIYSPSGVQEFATKKKGDRYEEDNEGFLGPIGQGHMGDPVELEAYNNLNDFHFQSYEEVLKGIFGDMGTTMPSAQMIQRTIQGEEQRDYLQKIADFLFHKKRLASRTTSTSGPLNIAPVVGFPMLIIDDSDAEQHLLGTLNTITHTINASGGGYTSYELGFVRYTEEIDFWSGEAYEPPIEPWYDPEIFGANREVRPEDYAALYKSQQGRIGEMGKVNDFGNSKLADFYKKLLGNSDPKGHMGATPVTSKKYPTVASAAIGLCNEYRAAKKTGSASSFISLHTRRDYVTLKENFTFLGATFKNRKTDPTYWKEADYIFKGAVFDGDFVKLAKSPNERDKQLESLFGTESTKRRRKPINTYRHRLKTERGFNG